MNPFRTITLALSFLAASLIPVQARIGETLEQVKQRYGPPIAVINTKFCEASDGGSYIFNVQVRSAGSDTTRMTVRVQIEFKNEKAWLVRYSSMGLSDRDRLDLMTLNLGDVIWSEPISGKGQKRTFWKDQKGNSRFATHYRSGGMHVLQILSSDCVGALALQRKQETTIIADMENWTPLVDPTKAKPAANADAKEASPVPGTSSSGANEAILPGL